MRGGGDVGGAGLSGGAGVGAAGKDLNGGFGGGRILRLRGRGCFRCQAQLKERVVSAGEEYRSDGIERGPGGAFARYDCNDPNQGA